MEPANPRPAAVGLTSAPESMPRFLQAAVGVLVLAVGVAASVRPIGVLPPLGAQLEPGGGVWALGRAASPAADRIVTDAAFTDDVKVITDDRGVPHIYAAKELDAYRALGFVVARDRLFQLEVQTRAAAGTLAELVGPRALALDRDARRLGFGRLVERTMREADTTSPAFQSVKAYAEGVNAWIDAMGPADLPIEYRLLGRRPARWAPSHTYFLLARMALTLAYNDASLIKAKAAARVGWPAAEALFPIIAPIQEPIQPNTIDSTRFGFVPIPPPGAPDSMVAAAIGALDGAHRTLGSFLRWTGDEALGSNNWAVAPTRSASRHALLAGDPHLELTLPSVWYQAHLVVGDRLDVAGVTIPGAPWVVIGFNRHLAWSMTNTGSDVNDFYRETVDDSTHPSRYLLDGAWKPLELRVETYRAPDGRILAVDTLRFSHRGPLWKVDSTWMSMAWTLYQGGSNGTEFLGIDRATSAAEFLESSASYAVPAQNMIVADQRGTIAIRSTGRYPVRPGPGRGDLIQDGSSAANDWVGTLPVEFYPFALNPARGFLSSANQQPVDPTVNPRFMGANWYSPWRAIRINTLLRADSQVTVDAMRRFQTDPGSARADLFVPALLRVGTDSMRMMASPRAGEALRLLTAWNRQYDVENTGPVLFEAVMAELGRRVWDELAPALARPGSDEAVTPRPAEAILLGLMADSANVWWDDRRTPVTERRDDILVASLAAGLDSAIARHGPAGNERWCWGNAHHANIYHLLHLPALSALDLPVQSGPSTLSPSSGDGTHGASWRMVVELGPQVTGWATYPGGQSGNPASTHYRDFLPAWLAGRLDSLIVPRTAESFPAGRIEGRTTFRKGR